MLNDVYEAPTWAWSFSQCLGLPGSQHNGIILYLNFLLWCSWRLRRNMNRLIFKVRTKKGDIYNTWEIVTDSYSGKSVSYDGSVSSYLSSSASALSNSCLQLLWPLPALAEPHSPWPLGGKLDNPGSTETGVKIDQTSLLKSQRWSDQTHQLHIGIQDFTVKQYISSQDWPGNLDHMVTTTAN